MENARHLLNAFLLSLLLIAGSIPVRSFAASESGLAMKAEAEMVLFVPSSGIPAPVDSDNSDSGSVLVPKINQALQLFHFQLAQQVIFLFKLEITRSLQPVKPVVQLMTRPPSARVLFRHFISRQAP